ncbi:hypothetical protein [Virgisporangium aurantiacum]|nr:hypothetical protein [Virgisporangium aurantiacum]
MPTAARVIVIVIVGFSSARDVPAEPSMLIAAQHDGRHQGSA